MRTYIVFCLAAVAFAKPQYSYDHSTSEDLGVPQLASLTPVIYNKQFYIHSAPEDALDDATGSGGSSLSQQKNLRVVFIKTPENRGLENAALQLAKSAGDSHTAIYILNKQNDLGELERKLAQSSNPNANKPEVHFVKYKTPAEAEHAQHVIQAQYNSLAGPTSISNEGVSPVQNFIGSAPSQSSGAESNAYLPPLKRI